MIFKIGFGPMYTLILIFLIAAIISFAAVPLIKKLASVVGAMDVPHSSLQIHNRPIPRLGGLAIFFGFVAAMLFGLSFGNLLEPKAGRQVLPLLFGATMIIALGVVDDIKGVQPWHRFFVQIPVAILLILFGIKINIPFVLPLGIVLTIFYVISACNSLNLLDGVDGLAAGATSIAAIGFCVVFLKKGDPLGCILSVALVGSTLGFLWYNFAPASIFMGDAGSLFLGYILAVLAIRYLRTPDGFLNFLVPVAILGVPIFDTALTVMRRSINRMPLLPGDRGHCYDKLMDRGLNSKQTVFIMYEMGIVFAITGILFTEIALIPAVILMACEIAGLIIMVLKFDMLSC